jgi:predicted RNase H-like nuclease
MGVDGAPGGWLGVVWDAPEVAVLYATSIDELFRAAGSPRTLAVDMPIGLDAHGARQADLAAREFLGPRRSTIFFSPVHAVLEAGDFRDYAKADRVSRRRGGRGLSRQAFGLLPKIDEVERWRHTVDAVVCEAHPEVTFQVLAGSPLRAGKKTWNGARERWRLLADAGVCPARDADAGAAAVDDVLDAAALAWTARRIATGRARTFPDHADPDEPAITA